ncbi:MAG: hypothetical protein ACHP65_08885 [Legionellales bacterium]
MNPSDAKQPYEARIIIGDKIISTTTGTSISELQAFLNRQCELEKSGVEGEIIEVSTGKTIYRCNRQTIIDD